MKWYLSVLLVAGAFTLLAAPPESYVAEFEETLTENILKFWHPRTIDKENGGYNIRIGPNGEDQGPGPKALVTQARTVWFFARAARAGYGDRKALLAAADHGYRFLIERMWNAKHGGFAWELDAAGRTATRPKIHMYGQSFALYALSEYAMASGRKDVLAFARKVFDQWERKAHDKQHGGYLEFFNEDWTPAAPGERSYMAGDSTVKLMNTHLHLMEALTTFYRASQLPLARERLLELMAIESHAVIRKGIVACTDQYQRDWTPILDGAGGRVSYGHDLENIWLLVDAADAAGVAVSPYLDLFRENFAYSMKYGWDTTHGGFWYSGWMRQPADNRTKSWWVQSEVLVSALTMYRLTGDPLYWRVFEETWAFVRTHQIDRKTGEWWEIVDDQLRPRGNKAHAWKAGYHNGRAMIEGITLLKQLGKEKR
jgi:cellobiose epimerase